MLLVIWHRDFQMLRFPWKSITKRYSRALVQYMRLRRMWMFILGQNRWALAGLLIVLMGQSDLMGPWQGITKRWSWSYLNMKDYRCSANRKPTHFNLSWAQKDILKFLLLFFKYLLFFLFWNKVQNLNNWKKKWPNRVWLIARKRRWEHCKRKHKPLLWFSSKTKVFFF